MKKNFILYLLTLTILFTNVSANASFANLKKILKNDSKLENVNESGEIMIHMFHRFAEKYEGAIEKNLTMTYQGFWDYLEKLYTDGYRPISMEDYINNNISLAKGLKPMIFTFDDAWASQFHLVKKDGKLIASEETGVGILEKFNKKYPDFDLRGVFYLNLSTDAFAGEGEMSERLTYLIDKGFELGNHSYNHVNFAKLSSSEQVEKHLGENEKVLKEYLKNERFSSLALPYGEHNKRLIKSLEKGEYEGVKYHNEVILLASSSPALNPLHIDFDPLNITRIIAPGNIALHRDANWWLKNIAEDEIYISDGDPNTITVPKNKAKLIDFENLGPDKHLRIY